MNHQRKSENAVLLWAVFSIPALWAGAILGSVFQDGRSLLALLDAFFLQAQNPFALSWTPHTPAFLLGSLVCYGFGIAFYYTEKGNRRPGVEHGSALWGSVGRLRSQYQDNRQPEQNILFTKHMKMGMNTHKHRRNLNVLVCGGSGSGKTRFYCLPNLMQANCSYIVADPKGEMLRTVAPLLLAKGYDIKVLNLIEPNQSDGYNPFGYLRNDSDVLKLVTNLMKNTTPKGLQSSADPFWEKAETALEMALMLYLLHEAPPEEQNFETVMYMIENGAAKEENEEYRSPLDLLFDVLEEEQPEHIALKEYKVFKQASGKTAKSILVAAAVRLAAFNLPEIASMTRQDDLDLASLGERKRAVFAVIPDNDSSFNYLVGMLYTQAFQSLYYLADQKYAGSLPVPVRLVMDEFANGATRSQLKRLGVKLKYHKELKGAFI